MSEEKTLEELREENRKLKEENEQLNKSIKERMYDKINVSVRTMDIFIGCMCVLFVVVVVLGMLK
ncbi:hypothetical protein AALB64_08255 [Lachnospiraceae bacterium 45-P1]